MHPDTPKMRMLCRALAQFDGEAAFAQALGVPREALTGWLAGASIPADAYVRTLAIIAGKGQPKRAMR